MQNYGTPTQPDSKLVRLLIIALLTAAVIFILGQVSRVARQFLDILFMLAMAWLVAFLLSPVINYLNRHPVPPLIVGLLQRRSHASLAGRLDRFHLPHTLAVVLVYVGVLVALAVLLVFAIPAIVLQLADIGKAAPKLIQGLPGLISTLQADLAARGLEADLSSLYQPTQLMQRAEALGAQIVQQAFALATGLASGLVNVLLVLTVSLYMSLDGPRLSRQLHAVIPDHYHGRLNLVGQSISRTFGGFMRGQLLIALLYGLPVTVLLTILGISLAIVVGIVCGFLMMVPLVGAPIAMVLPALVALLQSPNDALWLLIAMTVYQQILLQVMAPKLMSSALGLPALLVLIAIMVSMRIMGFWGLVFGIPLAGVIYALTVTYLEQSKVRRESLPQGLDHIGRDGIFILPAMGPGCLLIPELEGPPAEMVAAGQFLAGRGITTLGIQPYLDPYDTSWEDWYAAVLVALDRLWRECDQVFVVGKGMGALLAIHAASELPLAGVALISLPVRRDGDYHLRVPATTSEDQTLTVREQIAVLPAHTRTEIAHLQERTHAEMGAISCPVLLVHPENSEVAPPEDARYVLERLGTAHKRIQWVHEVKSEDDWLRVNQAIFGFFRNYIE